MGEKTIDLTRSVHSLCEEYPELACVLASLGFTEIVKPGMLNTVGRYMTIPKGAALRHVDMNALTAGLRAAGFTVI